VVGGWFWWAQDKGYTYKKKELWKKIKKKKQQKQNEKNNISIIGYGDISCKLCRDFKRSR
jgi:NADH/NAD ratio-sensing transcriptional regulator Rex